MLLVMLGMISFAMLYFGIRFKGFRPANRVKWTDSGVGIAFSRYGMAYTDGFFETAVIDDNTNGLTIEMAISPEFPRLSNFRFLLAVHDGKDQDQLVIGQWRFSLVIMNGDDYSNKLRRPKLYLQLDENKMAVHLVTVVSGKKGTRVYLDGELKQSLEEMVLCYPKRVELARLVVGNSPSAKHPWVGEIYGLSFFDRILDEATVQQHYQAWRYNRDFNVFKVDKPKLLYAFDEGKGKVVHDKINGGLNLTIPDYLIMLQKKVLSWPQLDNLTRAGMVGDVVQNLIGFMPLGFILMWLLSCVQGLSIGCKRLIVVFTAFAFSFSIEIAQVWIPSRDSSILDLILNTLGGYLGVMLSGRLTKQGTV